MSRRWLAGALLVGAALRFYPIWFGLPFLEARPDEETAIAHANLVLRGDLNPHFFHWPSFVFYLFAAWLRVASWAARPAGVTALSPNAQYLLARALVAAAGTLTIAVVFRLGRRLAGAEVGAAAACLLAVATLHVRDSHFAMTDVLMTLLVTLSLAGIVQALDLARDGERRRAHRWFAAAGFVGGLAASTKYSAAAIVAAMAAAPIVLAARTRRVAVAPVVLFAAAFAAGFLAGTPYAILDARAFLDGVAVDVLHLSRGHSGGLGVGWIYHATHSLPLGVGLPIAVAAAIGFVFLARDHRPGGVIVTAFAVAFYAAIGGGRTVFFRYVLPLVPVMCLSAAVAARHLSGRLPLLPRSVGFGALVALLAAPPLVNSVWLDVVLARTDTRVLAGRWLAQHVTPDESLFDAGGVYAQADVDGAHARVHVWTTNGYDPDIDAFRNAGGRIPVWIVMPESPLPVYTDVPDGLRRLVAREYVLAYVERGTRGAIDSEGYDPDDAFFVPFSGFRRIIRPGPTILIYRVRASQALAHSPATVR